MKMSDGWHWFQGPCTWHAGSLSHCRGVLGHFNITEPSLMLLVTPLLFLLQQVKISVVKKAYWTEYGLTCVVSTLPLKKTATAAFVCCRSCMQVQLFISQSTDGNDENDWCYCFLCCWPV